MKRSILAALAALLLGFPLCAQSEVETENYKTLSQYAARPQVVASRCVPRSEFPLWISHLPDRSWGADGNWYPPETQRLYFTRVTEAGDTDICWSEPLNDTLWRTPVPVCDAAVSPGNERFPMLSPDGRRLYFSSDSLFGAGGYDLYVAMWDPERKAWGAVQNLGVPFNSPGDDLFFCETPDGRYSVLVSDRACGKDSVVIYVLRQEVPVFSRVSPEEARRRGQLMVTAPDDGYRFEKRNPCPIPKLKFEETSVTPVTEEVRIVK